MNVPMRHDARAVFVDQVQEGFKSSVCKVGVIAQSERGGVSEQDIESLCTPEPEKELAHPFVHLALGVLMRTAVIAHAAAEAKDTNAFVNVYLVLNADAALRGLFFILAVVITMDLEDGRMGKAGEKG